MPQQAEVWLWKLWLAAFSFVVLGCAAELDEFEEEELDDEDEE